jgi:predicted P-loop ATPase
VREQLFAEAVQAYQWGEPLYLDDEVVNKLATGEQAKRQHMDEWIGTVAEIVRGKLFPKEFEIRDVAKNMHGTGADKMGNWDVQRIARCLTLLGCTSFREGGGDRRRLWISPADFTHTSRRPRSVQGALDVTNREKDVEIVDFS